MSYLRKSHISTVTRSKELNRIHSLTIQKFKQTTVKSAVSHWLKNLTNNTKKNYAYHITDLIRRGIIPEFDSSGNDFTIGLFNLTPHEHVIDFIKTVKEWSEGTRQVKAACYISFTAYLQRISQGWFRKAEPSTLASNKTFFSVRDKCETKAISLHEWNRFIEALHKINYRDALIARAMIQGAKRISEVLPITLEQIDFEKRIINFVQSKTGRTIKKIPITYSETFFNDLKNYLEKTKKFRGESKTVFLTNRGNTVSRFHLNRSFKRASKVSKVIGVTPHVLRATWITIAKGHDVPDSEIMKVTGHTSSKLVYAYDKRSAVDNYSKKLIIA